MSLFVVSLTAANPVHFGEEEGGDELSDGPARHAPMGGLVLLHMWVDVC